MFHPPFLALLIPPFQQIISILHPHSLNHYLSHVNQRFLTTIIIIHNSLTEFFSLALGTRVQLFLTTDPKCLDMGQTLSQWYMRDGNWWRNTPEWNSSEEYSKEHLRGPHQHWNYLCTVISFLGSYPHSSTGTFWDYVSKKLFSLKLGSS